MAAVPTVRQSQAAPQSAGLPPQDEISAYHLVDEQRLVAGLIDRAVFTEDERRRTGDLARGLVHSVRANRHAHGGIDAFMAEYALTSEEGIILMCLAEALLRVPDAETADSLIAEKIGGGQWQKHLGQSESVFVNASTFGLMLTGRMVKLGDAKGGGPAAALKRLIGKSGEPVIRQAVRQAMKVLGDNFVLGRTIKEAIGRAHSLERQGYRFSYDMLGEGARTARDAERYFRRYAEAIDAVGAAAGPAAPAHAEGLFARPSLSVKLSAIHPRFEPGKADLLAAELHPRLLELARLAKARNVGLTVDAEEQERLEITLAAFGKCFADPSLADWNGFGLAVQAYGRRAIPVLRWLRTLAQRSGRRIPVRLVKGAYWDSEIKWAQERGWTDYPVFTSKTNTDVSYLACMRFLMSDPAAFYPQFATHNAHTAAAVHVTAGSGAFEFQRLHGMGEALHEEIAGPKKLGRACRIYAPVGGHEDLLAYLVRRLLENGANTSFVNRLADEAAPISDIIRDPVEAAEMVRVLPLERRPAALPRPPEIFEPDRPNSEGLVLTERAARERLLGQMTAVLQTSFAAGPIVDGLVTAEAEGAELVRCPHDLRTRLGTVRVSTPQQIAAAVASADAAQHDWDRLGGAHRAGLLDKAADLFERDRARLMAVIVREGGKTLDNALGDVREAVDFLRYYAREARRLFGGEVQLKGVTGERNTIELKGRGAFACIAPWNFPLAIFTGQVAAALAAGNTVLAKCAPQTPITAFLAVQLLHEAGVPKDVLHLLTGGGAAGAALVKEPRVAGIAFTGSNETAWAIQKALSEKRGALIPFIAETGGINAMIADSTALPEQVVRDAVRSAFDSAGQRCSAARVLFVQDDIAPRVIDMLRGATELLDVGDPLDFATDVGPVIDETAQDALDAHKMRLGRSAKLVTEARLGPECRAGTFVAPAIFEIDRLGVLEREVFGPILHVIRFAGGKLDQVVDAINATGYGLTLGVHSRIAAVADRVAERARVGNIYVNRNQIGAVVGVQPFGGEGLSGAGPKAGGPNYLVRFATERVVSTDITATGGNVQLLGLVADRS